MRYSACFTFDASFHVYLADGKYKTLENLKKKNKKHIQVIKKNADDILREFPYAFLTALHWGRSPARYAFTLSAPSCQSAVQD